MVLKISLNVFGVHHAEKSFNYPRFIAELRLLLPQETEKM